MITMYSKDNLRLIVGRVCQDVRFDDKDGSKIAVVRLEDRNGDKVDVYFKNDPSATNKMLADRIEKAKVAEGKWLSMLVLMKDTDAATATGLDFKYSGIWHFKNTEGKETNIMVGYSTRPERLKDDLFRVSMAEDIYNDGATETRWFSVSFFDDERTLHSKIAERQLAVEGRKSVPCAIRCSAIKEKESNGNTYYNLTGYKVEAMYTAEAA